MDKKYHMIQTAHNQFMRGAVASACKIFLWTLVYAGIIGIICGVMMANVPSALNDYQSSLSNSASYSSSKNSTSKDSKSTENPFVVGGGFIVLVTIVYLVAVAYEVNSKIRTNKELVAIENEYFKAGGATKEDNISAKKKNNINNNSKNDVPKDDSNSEDESDDML